MPQDVPFIHFDLNPLQTLFPEPARELVINLMPGLTLPKGTVLTQVPGPISDSQTITVTGTPTGGTLTLSGTDPLTLAAFTTPAIAFNATAAQVASALGAQLGMSNVAATGGPFPGAPITFTLQGNRAGLAMGGLTVNAAGLTGGTPAATVAHTVAGVGGGTYRDYAGARLAAPTAAPVPTAAAGGTFAAGSYLVAISYTNGVGETVIGPPATVVLTAGQQINLASITLPPGVTGVNYYASITPGGVMYLAGSGTGGAASIAGPPPATTAPPAANTSAKAQCVLKLDCNVDAGGMITYGQAGAFGTGATNLVPYRSVSAWFAGTFYVTDLLGLDAQAERDLSGSRPSSNIFRFG